jgi:hypothetical protein
MGLPAPSVLLIRAVASRGHESDEDVTAFDATALAIQDRRSVSRWWSAT